MRKKKAEVLMWLDRLSLDAVQSSCTLLEAVVDVYLPMAPKRVLESVIFKCFADCTANLFASCSRRSSGMMVPAERGFGFRRMFARCSGCAIEYFRVKMATWTPTIRAVFAESLPLILIKNAQLHCPFVLSNALIQVMRGLEGVYISRNIGGTTDETMRICAERGVARLIVYNGGGVTDEALLDFCFSSAPMNGDDTERMLFMRFGEKTTKETSLSKTFFDKMVKKCFDRTPKPLPSVTLGCVVDTTSYDWMAKTHANQLCNCTHFQFERSGEKFEIVVRKDQHESSDLVVRKGHADIGECGPRRYSCEWEGREIYI